MSQPHVTPELEALADELRRLAPREPGLDRDALLFRAGQASVRRGLLWPATAAVSAIAAAALGTILLLQPPPQTVVTTIHVRVEAPAPSPSPSPQVAEPGDPVVETSVPDDMPPHRRLQEHLLRWGLDGLGQPAPVDRPPSSQEFFSPYSRLSSGESMP